MQGDDVGLVRLQAEKLTVTIGDISMRRPVKSVPADSMTPIELVRESVKVGVLRESLVKSSVENGRLRQPAPEKLARREDSANVCRVVKRRQIYAVFDLVKHVVVDKHRLSEPFATVNDAMTDGVYVADTVNVAYAGTLRARPPDYESDRGARIAQWFGGTALWPAVRLQRDDGFASDSFDQSPRESPIGVARDHIQIGSNELEFQIRAPAV
jgi:hypothetical protein